MPQDGNGAEDRVIDFNRVDAAPAPGRQVRRCVRPGYYVLNCLGEHFVGIRIAGRQPLRRLMQQDSFHPHRPHEPVVGFPGQAGGVVGVFTRRRAEFRFKQQPAKFSARKEFEARSTGIGAHLPVPIAHKIAGFSGAGGNRLYMIERIDESLCAEAIELGVDVGLQRQHIRRGEFLA